MKAIVLYRPKSEHARQVEEFVHDFSKTYPDKKIEVVDIDSKEGASTAELYDAVNYPAILMLTDDGQLLKHWNGDILPLMDEVAYYTH